MLAVLLFICMALAFIALHLPLDGRRWLAMAFLAGCAALAFVAATHAAVDGRHWLAGQTAGRYGLSVDFAYLLALGVLAALALPRVGPKPSTRRWLWPALAATIAAPLCYALAAPLSFAVATDHWWQKVAVLDTADALTTLALLYWCLWLATRERPLPGRLGAAALLATGAAFVGLPLMHTNWPVLVVVGFWCATLAADGRRLLRLSR